MLLFSLYVQSVALRISFLTKFVLELVVLFWKFVDHFGHAKKRDFLRTREYSFTVLSCFADSYKIVKRGISYIFVLFKVLIDVIFFQQ